MDCKRIKSGLESVLYDQLVDNFGREMADKKAIMFESDTFLKEFGDYTKLMDEKSELIPAEFANRLNEKLEPMLSKDDVGLYYLDLNFEKQYIDLQESELYNIFQSQRAVNSLVEILSNMYIEQGGFNLDFDTLNMSDNSSETSLRDSVILNIAELGSELLESENDELLNNGGSLFRVLDSDESIDELITKIKNNYKSKNINYKEELNFEDVSEDTAIQRDPSFSRASFEVNPKQKISTSVKIRLSLIKDPTNIDPDFGQPKSIDYNSLYNKITAILKDNPVTVDSQGNVEDIFETIIDKLKSHSNNIKYLSNIVHYLEKISRLPVDLNTKEGINILYFKAGFVNAMNLQKNVYDTSEITQKGIEVVPAETKEVILPNGAIKNEIIKEAILGVEYKYNKFDASKDTKFEKSIIANWDLAILNHFDISNTNEVLISRENALKLLEIRNKLKQLSVNDKFTNKEKADNILKL